MTRVVVTADPHGRRARVSTTSGHLRPMVLTATGSSARVALVPERALLLAGDGVLLDVHVGAGATLDLVEPAGTVAYAMHGDAADWEVRIRVDSGGRLVWHGEPFVVAQGARVRRTTTIDLTPGATLALREVVVLGRVGEGPGEVRGGTRVLLDGRPVLVEDLLLGPASAVPGVLGDHRVVEQVLDLRPDAGQPGTAHPDTTQPDAGPDTMRLETYGVLYRRLGRHGHDASLEAVWAGVRVGRSSH